MLQKLYHSSYMARKLGIKAGTAGGTRGTGGKTARGTKGAAKEGAGTEGAGTEGAGTEGAGTEGAGENMFIDGNLQINNTLIHFSQVSHKIESLNGLKTLPVKFKRLDKIKRARLARNVCCQLSHWD